MNYTQALKKVMDKEPAAQGYSRDELNDRIAAIGQQLKGPMRDVERILLCGDRAAYRKALAALSAEADANAGRNAIGGEASREPPFNPNERER